MAGHIWNSAGDSGIMGYMVFSFTVNVIQICCREMERRLGGGDGKDFGNVCVGGCWIVFPVRKR